MKLFKTSLTFFFALLISAAAFAAPGGISGKVLSKDGNEPLSYVTIKVQDKLMGTLTHADGSFSLDGLEPGCYSISIDQNGYQSQEICDILVEDGKTSETQVELQEDEIEMEAYSINSLENSANMHLLDTVTIYANAGSDQVSSWGNQKLMLSHWSGKILTWIHNIAAIR